MKVRFWENLSIELENFPTTTSIGFNKASTPVRSRALSGDIALGWQRSEPKGMKRSEPTWEAPLFRYTPALFGADPSPYRSISSLCLVQRPPTWATSKMPLTFDRNISFFVFSSSDAPTPARQPSWSEFVIQPKSRAFTTNRTTIWSVSSLFAA